MEDGVDAVRDVNENGDIDYRLFNVSGSRKDDWSRLRLYAQHRSSRDWYQTAGFLPRDAII